MKKLCFLFLLCSSSLFAQKKSPYSLYLGCYSASDSIPSASLYKIDEIYVLEDGKPQTKAWLKKYDLSCNTNGTNKSIGGFENSAVLMDTQINALIKASSFQINSIELYVREGDKITVQKLPAHSFYRSEKVYPKKCN